MLRSAVLLILGAMVCLTPAALAQDQIKPEANRADHDKTDIWMDVDTANGVADIDDGLMMIAAFHSPEVNIRGISTVFGNAPLKATYPIALNITRAFGPEGLTVEPGAASAEELGKITPAVEAMAAALREKPMTILAVGPVTNVGTLVQQYPDLCDRIQSIVMVAARRSTSQKFESLPNQPREFPDANFEHDPDAMQAILDTEVPLVFAPWEVSSHVWVSRDDLKHLRDTGGSGLYVYATSQHWIESWENRLNAPGGNPFDTLALGYVVHPEWMKGYPATMKIVQGAAGEAWNRQQDRASDAEPRKKPFLIATEVKDGEKPDRSAIYLYLPDEAFKPWLLDRLSGPQN